MRAHPQVRGGYVAPDAEASAESSSLESTAKKVSACSARTTVDRSVLQCLTGHEGGDGL